MSSLEQLTKTIIDDAKAEAARIEAAAHESADAVLAQKRAELDTLREIEQARIDKDAHAASQRLKAQEQTRARDKKLMAKQNMLDEVFDNALSRMNNMNMADFAEYVEKTLAHKNLGGGQLILPESHIGLDTAALSKKLGNVITKHQTRRTSGGFIFVAGGVEYNNTFADLLNYYRDELEAAVSQMIF